MNWTQLQHNGTFCITLFNHNEFSNSLDEPKIFKIQENLMIIIINL